jgi:hydrogenase maturation protease
MLLIIAYGNLLRGDDGAGLALGELIEHCCRQRSIEVRRLVCQQLTPELVPALIHPGIAQILFCDTRISGPGDHDLGIAVKPLEPGGGGATIGHHLSPATLLLFAKELYQCAVPAWQVTVPGSAFEFGQTFSKPTRQALGDAVPLIELFLDRIVVATTPHHGRKPQNIGKNSPGV